MAEKKTAPAKPAASKPRRARKTASGSGKREILHQAILQAADEAGQEFGDAGLISYLRAQALATPSPFLTLLGKVLAEAEIAPPPAIRRIELVPAASASACAEPPPASPPEKAAETEAAAAEKP